MPEGTPYTQYLCIILLTYRPFNLRHLTNNTVSQIDTLFFVCNNSKKNVKQAKNWKTRKDNYEIL